MSGVLTTTGTPSTTRVWRYFFDRQPPLTKDENRECIGIYCSTIASLSVVFGIYLWSGLYHLKKYSIAPTIVLLAISFVLCLMIINWLTIGVYALIRQCHHHQQQQVKETSECNNSFRFANVKLWLKENLGKSKTTPIDVSIQVHQQLIV
ncbi:unnamed protein product [Rotaria magnacalcarata]|uniref:Uncharacterized protein n=1 Tax=Rotaria magnacalcarata TaxID=392030 RepID=A0A816TXW8_9BILA|nr:unnamed protein product [Rotaria magnacalcarata]CAF2100870.1 unnamed protein product [Rotaria magnacalcarata]